MFFEIILFIIIGIIAGCFTGLIPGIHINLVAAFLISISALLLNHFSILSLCIFIISMSITHTFVSVIPAIFFGAPESANALGVLPGHRFLLKGFGLDAVKLTIIGSYFAIIISIVFFPLFILIVQKFYPIIRNYIGFILIIIATFMVLRDKKKTWAIFVFFLSGSFGLIVFNLPSLNEPLFPMLSGLFGISTLLISINSQNKIPIQKITTNLKLKFKTTIKALLSGQFSGFLTSILPGLGSATAAVISMQITRNLKDKGFMILIGSISTVNFVLSLVAFFVLNRARNGSIIAVQKLINEITILEVLIFLSSALIVGSISVYITLKLGVIFSKIINIINYKKTVIAVIIFITLLVFLISGFLGLFVLLIATAIGIIPAITKITRTHSMGCILLPVILFFIL
jgi:putative membrane protein